MTVPVPVPDSLDPHGGATAADLAAWYGAALAEVTDHCLVSDLRPSSVQVCSWLFGIRSVVIGFPGSDTASVDTLGVSAWELPLDPAPPPSLYQRTGAAAVAGSPASVTVYTSDPDAPPATFEPAAATEVPPSGAAVQVVLPTPAPAPATETHMLAPPASAAP